MAGAVNEIATVVSELGRATASHDFAAVCDDLLTSAARERAGGNACVRNLRARTAGVRRPRIVLRRVNLRERSASARVVARAAGEDARREVLELRREDGEWRIEAVRG